MRIIPIFLLFLGITLFITACSSSNKDQEHGHIQGNPDSSENEEARVVNKVVDLSQFDPCTVISAVEIAAIVGELDLEKTKRITELEKEKGCQWVNVEGQFFEIIYYPPIEWEMAGITTYKPEPVKEIGDDAILGKYADAHFLKVLVQGKAMIGIRASNKDLETAKQLFHKVAMKYLPNQ